MSTTRAGGEVRYSDNIGLRATERRTNAFIVHAQRPKALGRTFGYELTITQVCPVPAVSQLLIDIDQSSERQQ